MDANNPVVSALNWIVETCNATNGVAAWAVVVGSTFAWLWTRRVWLRQQIVDRRDALKSAARTASKAAVVAGVAIFLDRGISRRAVVTSHQALTDAVHLGGEPADSEPLLAEHPPSADEQSDQEPVPDAGPPRHTVAKPTIIQGKVSHQRQPFTQFVEAHDLPGYWRCKICNQLGSWQKGSQGNWQFVEAQLAPGPIYR